MGPGSQCVLWLRMTVQCADKRHSVRLGVKECLLDRWRIQLDRRYDDGYDPRILETNRYYRSYITTRHRGRPYTCV